MSDKKRRKSVTDASASDSWATPPELFAALDALFGPFTLDAAASARNAKCVRFFDEADNALARPWNQPRVWCNPPYSRGNKPAFLQKARAEMARSDGPEVITLLVPHNTAEGWWAQYVDPSGEVITTRTLQSLLGRRTVVHLDDLVIETLPLRGRVSFAETTGTGYRQTTAPFSSVVITFSRPGVLYPIETRHVPARRGPKYRVTPEREAMVLAGEAAGLKRDAAIAAAGLNRRTWYRHVARKVAP